MRERALVLALFLALAAPDLALAEIGKPDVVPAATLLFPYFEVDPGSMTGQTTLITIQNAAPDAVLTRVTLWTDLGVPTLGFDVYLTGYDILGINLFDVIARGAFQRTAPANVDPGGTSAASNSISPKGPFSTDIAIPSCAGLLPYKDIWEATLTAGAIADLIAAHTGVVTSAGTCSGSPRGDGIARGYITVDTVSGCSALTSLPNAPGYFGAGGIVTDQNVLLGDFMLIHSANNFGSGEQAVHIEADAALAGTPTFYARFTAATGADHRERLFPASLISLRGNRVHGTISDGIVWRDPGVPTAPFPCGAALPAPFPLPQNWASLVDDQSSLVDLTADLFPFASGTTEIFPALVAPGKDPRLGWFSLGLNATDQMWMIGRRRSEGRFEAAVSGPTEFGATLLLPHFEIAASPPVWNGSPRVLRQPRMFIGNRSSNPTLAHVTFWTDLGVPTFGFDVYLAGQDVTEVNLRLALEGVLPPTGPAVTARGTPATTGPPVNFPNCSGQLPPSRVPATQVSWIKAAHGGLPLPAAPGTCAGHAWGDGALRGYVTVDVVNRCSSAFPGDPASGSDPAYFVSGGTGIASNANVLWGEWWIEDSGDNQVRADRLVAIRADNALSTAGSYTFYGRRLGGSAADNRERLPSVWQGRWIAGGAASFVTTAVVWRDPGLRTPFACGSESALRQREVTTFDERSFAADLSAGAPPGYDTLLPLAAERIPRPDLRFPFLGAIAGFYHFDLRFPASTADALFGGANQAYVAIEFRNEGRLGAAVGGRPVEGVAGSMYPIP
jgi:hypothetical protein